MAEAAPRKRRINGEESRTRILDAATAIASERGYEGTSIGLVSKTCGLPASSIYWHFKNKDDLIAAVIERSFGEWLGAWEPPQGSSGREGILDLARQVARSLQASPDFLRLGLMLALEKRPEEPSAREMFLRVRAQATERLVELFSALAPTLPADVVERLSQYTLAAADGLFIAKEIGGDDVDLEALFAMHANAIIALTSSKNATVVTDTGTLADQPHA